MKEFLQQALTALENAKDAVEFWSGYASEYFQKKHDLDGDIAGIDADMEKLRVAIDSLTQQDAQPVRAEIAALRRKLEDARKDAERLDWMEANPESPSVPYFDITNHWLIPFLSNGAGGFGGGVGYRSYTTLRAAIDAAMKERK